MPPRPPENGKPAIVVLTSLVARGGVGGRAGVFALERLGHRVWFVPTVILPFHPGHGAGTRLDLPQDRFTALVDDLASSRWTGEIGAVLTGYMGSPAQTETAAGLIDRLRSDRDDLLVVCDPISGDGGTLYIAEETAASLRDVLVPRADLVTPNLTELAYLSRTDFDRLNTPGAAADAAARLGRPHTLVTSAPALLRNAVATMLIEGNGALVAEHQQFANAPHGPGDLLAALVTSHRLAGAGSETTLTRSVSSTFEIVARSVKAGSEELLLQAEQAALIRPSATVSIRRLALPFRK